MNSRIALRKGRPFGIMELCFHGVAATVPKVKGESASRGDS
jgi:hypothetical protein